MRGTVRFWKANDVFKWGFVAEDGTNGNRRDQRIYFNEKSAHYAPVKIGDTVEFTLRQGLDDERGRCAQRVEKVEDDDDV